MRNLENSKKSEFINRDRIQIIDKEIASEFENLNNMLNKFDVSKILPKYLVNTEENSSPGILEDTNLARLGELLDTLKTKQLFIDRDLQIIRSEHNKINNELQQVRQILDNLRGHRIDGVTDDLLETRIDELMDTADRLNTRDQYLFDEYQRLNSLSTSYKAYYQNLLNRNFLTGNQQIFGPPDVSQSLTDFLNYADTVSNGKLIV